jgi:hypothetical protein
MWKHSANSASLASSNSQLWAFGMVIAKPSYGTHSLISWSKSGISPFATVSLGVSRRFVLVQFGFDLNTMLQAFHHHQ